jgi:hypothetical protein
MTLRNGENMPEVFDSKKWLNLCPRCGQPIADHKKDTLLGLPVLVCPVDVPGNPIMLGSNGQTVEIDIGDGSQRGAAG